MKLPSPRNGSAINPPARGFPVFTGRSRQRRIITSDIWEYLRYLCRRKLASEQRNKALAFIDQAFEFFSAAANQRQSSRPLLYYYSFLNLAKIALLFDGVRFPAALRHGISDPKANHRTRLHFKTQVVRIEGQAVDHSALFPELIRIFSKGRYNASPQDFKVLELLAEIPAIHRTYNLVTDSGPCYVPIERVHLLRDGSNVWARINFNARDKDVKAPLDTLQKRKRFKKRLHRVKSDDEWTLAFETKPLAYRGRKIDTQIAQLAADLRALSFHSTLTREGYRLYLLSKGRPSGMPQLCVCYAVMFYLGSLTRYKPYDYEKVTQGYSWVLGEFLDTQPPQFLTHLASFLGRTEVVMPYAVAVQTKS